jgi:Glycosyl hydrolase family 76
MTPNWADDVIGALSIWGSASNGWHIGDAWNRFQTVEALVHHTLYAGKQTYAGDAVTAAWDSGLSGNDDQLWGGIAYAKLYHLTGDGSHIQRAIDKFEMVTAYWDHLCMGGVWWDIKRTYKNAITNELYLMLATLLYEMLGDNKYLQAARDTWDWFDNSGMINSFNMINDGISSSTCLNNGQTTWTYNQGVILGGLVNLARLTGDAKLLTRAFVLANATIVTLVSNGILQEPTEESPLSNDRQQFKGIFCRYLAYLAASAPSNPSAPALIAFIENNAHSVRFNSVNKDNQVNCLWDLGAPTSDKYYTPMAQTSGIDLFNAEALVSGSAAKVSAYPTLLRETGASSSPALAIFDDKLYAAWAGVGSDNAGIYYAYHIATGKSNEWTKQTKIPGVGTDSGPTLAAFNGALYALWRGVGSDPGIWYASLPPGGQWSAQQKITGVGTKTRPAAVVFNGALYALWRGVGSDPGIWYASLPSGGQWSAQQKITGVGTDCSPAVAVFNGVLYAAWRGVDDDAGIWFATMRAGGSWSGQQKVVGVGTKTGPSLAVHDNALWMAWRGIGENAVFYASMQADGKWSQQTTMTIPATTTRVPTLASYPPPGHKGSSALWNMWSGVNGLDESQIWCAHFPAFEVQF